MLHGWAGLGLEEADGKAVSRATGVGWHYCISEDNRGVVSHLLTHRCTHTFTVPTIPDWTFWEAQLARCCGLWHPLLAFPGEMDLSLGRSPSGRTAGCQFLQPQVPQTRKATPKHLSPQAVSQGWSARTAGSHRSHVWGAEVSGKTPLALGPSDPRCSSRHYGNWTGIQEPTEALKDQNELSHSHSHFPVPLSTPPPRTSSFSFA